MALKISNYPDKSTAPYYARLMCREPFWLKVPWSESPLPSQDKADEYGLGATNAMDITAPCWIFQEGRVQGVPVLVLQPAADEEMLERGNPPCPVCLPVLRGANLIELTAEPAPEPEPDPGPQPPGEEPGPEPEEPAPEPGPPALDRVPRSITIYGGGMSRLVFTWWGDHFVATVPREQFMAVWEMLVERIGAWFDR